MMLMLILVMAAMFAAGALVVIMGGGGLAMLWSIALFAIMLPAVVGAGLIMRALNSAGCL